MPPRARTVPTVILAGVALLALPGCLVTSSSATAYSGNRVEPAAEAGVTLHRTSPEQTVAMLGEPTARTVNDDGEEVLTWQWTRKSASSGRVFLLFGGSSKTTQDHALHIAYKDGVAVRKWRR